MTHQPATSYVRTLESEGILREVTGLARHRVYQADAIVEAIVAHLPRQEDEPVRSIPKEGSTHKLGLLRRALGALHLRMHFT